jgi:hypothetical protein
VFNKIWLLRGKRISYVAPITAIRLEELVEKTLRETATLKINSSSLKKIERSIIAE